MGPLLFTIFINDLEDNVKNRVLKFADDSKLWGRVGSIEERMSLQKDLDILGEWSIRNKMPFNVGKCKVMHVGKNEKFEYSILGKKIQSSLLLKKRIWEYFFQIHSNLV